MNSQRQTIFDMVVGQLKTIKRSNVYTMYNQTANYKTDIGNRVFAWRAAAANMDEDDFLVVRDLDEPVNLPTPYAKRFDRQLHMQVELLTRSTTHEKKIRNEYLPDIEIAIGVGAETVWNEIGNTRPRKSISVVEQQSERIAGVIFEFYIDYPGYAFYPYTIS